MNDQRFFDLAMKVIAGQANDAERADLDALLEYLRRNAEELGIDEKRIGVWACSGNVPNALSQAGEQGDDTHNDDSVDISYRARSRMR